MANLGHALFSSTMGQQGESHEVVERAARHFSDGIEVSSLIGDTAGAGRCHMGLGYVHARLGRPAEAEAEFRAHVGCCEEAGDVAGQASGWANLHGLLDELGPDRAAEAEAAKQQTVLLARQSGMVGVGALRR
jgi:hypothetical protein